MSDDPNDAGTPTSKQLRDARRQAHETQKKSASGSDKMGMKKGKGGRKP